MVKEIIGKYVEIQHAGRSYLFNPPPSATVTYETDRANREGLVYIFTCTGMHNGPALKIAVLNPEYPQKIGQRFADGNNTYFFSKGSLTEKASPIILERYGEALNVELRQILGGGDPTNGS